MVAPDHISAAVRCARDSCVSSPPHLEGMFYVRGRASDVGDAHRSADSTERPVA